MECEDIRDPASWKEDHLYERFNGCLERLIACIKKGDLPQYFNRDFNLLAGKEKQLQEMVDRLERWPDVIDRIFDEKIVAANILPGSVTGSGDSPADGGTGILETPEEIQILETETETGVICRVPKEPILSNGVPSQIAETKLAEPGVGATTADIGTSGETKEPGTLMPESGDERNPRSEISTGTSRAPHFKGSSCETMTLDSEVRQRRRKHGGGTQLGSKSGSLTALLSPIPVWMREDVDTELDLDPVMEYETTGIDRVFRSREFGLA